MQKATRTNVHFDSALFAALLLLYPLYLVLLGVLLAWAVGAWWFLFPVVVLPALARCYVLWK